jgi:hypothetical protein
MPLQRADACFKKMRLDQVVGGGQVDVVPARALEAGPPPFTARRTTLTRGS